MRLWHDIGLDSCYLGCYLQEKGICHRDLSLENILVDVNHCLSREPGRSVDVTKGSLRLLITPMGLVGRRITLAAVDSCCADIFSTLDSGVLKFFANKSNFDGFAVDLWSAGVILYIMVTGFPPYDMPAREDERFQIICNGDLMKQLEAWKFTYQNHVVNCYNGCYNQIQEIDQHCHK
ncbi:hypothetical protein ACHAWO_002122 [Cyclotella atomus]|uniref:Protein kinase domain-containing protein n=1 Tax=Cyclotella atomus TaxID=382360 RepID=A0ABD3NQC9_9STRA